VAMFYYRRVLEWAESYVPDGDDGAATRAEWRIPGIGLTPEELAEKAFEQMAEVNDDVARGLRAADTQLRIALTALAQAYVADELPRTGLALLAQTEELVGTSAATTELFESIRADADIDLRQRRRLRVDPELSFWYANNDQWKAAGDDVVGKATGLTYLPYTELPPAEFLLEATVHIDALLGDGNQLFGLFLGSGFGERQVIAWESGLQQLVRLGVGLEGIALEGPIAPLRLKEGDTVNLGLDVSPEQVKFLIDGVEVGTFVYEPAQTRGQVGLMVQSAQARFSNLRLTY
jgi:hypothetical protein